MLLSRRLKSVFSSISGHRLVRTYIFTLDSLGTRHPQAIKVLKQYLVSEARDKHGFDEVRDAVGKQVQVYKLSSALIQTHDISSVSRFLFNQTPGIAEYTSFTS